MLDLKWPSLRGFGCQGVVGLKLGHNLPELLIGSMAVRSESLAPPLLLVSTSISIAAATSEWSEIKSVPAGRSPQQPGEGEH